MELYHSLLNEIGEIIKPMDCKVNKTKLLQSYPELLKSSQSIKPLLLNEIVEILDKYDNIERTIEEKEAFILGCFYGDGSCGFYNCPSGNKYSWAINNQDIKLLEMCKKYLTELYGGSTSFKILETMKSSGVRKLIPKGHIKYMVNKFRSLFYDKDKYKIIPNKILNAEYNVQLQFFIGYYAADGSKSLNSNVKNIRFCSKGKIGCSQLYYLVKSLGYSVSIQIRNDKPDIYRLTCCLNDCSSRKQRKIPNMIKKIIDLGYSEDYVYDLETEVGIFQAGIGEIIVKNTDSIFVSYDMVNKHGDKIIGKEALKASIDISVDIEKNFQKLLKKPHNLEYEKTFYPFMLFSKKRYVGNLYEFDIEKFKQKSMGIVLKRRDNANIVKIIYGGIIDIILNQKDIL